MGLENPNQRAYNYDLTPEESRSLKGVYGKDWGRDRPLIMDPFSGGGSIPFESLRMGCDVLASDYSPLASLIQNATIQYPARYSKKLWLDVDEAMTWIIDHAYDSLKEFYPPNNQQDIVTYLYAWVVRCPECGFQNPLMSQWWLVKRPRKRLYLEPTLSEDKIQLSIKTEGTPPPGNISGGEAHCLKCNQTMSGDYLLREILKNEDEMLMATVTLGKNGKEYSLPTSADLNAVEEARIIGKDIDDFIHIQDLIPLDEIPEEIEGKTHAQPYLKYWHKLLNPREKILFSTLIESIREYADSLNDDNYREAILIYLAFMVGKHINRNCRSARYNRKHENIMGTVSQEGIPLLWDHTETNPFVLSSGSLFVIKDEILKGLEYSFNHLPKNLNHSSPDYLKTDNRSVLESNYKTPLIVTDIPYQDDVQYAEMGDFFYVFERSVLNQYMDLPSESPKTQDLSTTSGMRTTTYFEHLFHQSFLKLHLLLEDDGLMVIYFNNQSLKSWEYLINTLIKSGFQVTALWPFHTQQPVNPILQDYASLESSLIVVARKMNHETSWKRYDINSHLEKRIPELWDQGLRGTDLTVSLMGSLLSVLIPDNMITIDNTKNREELNTVHNDNGKKLQWENNGEIPGINLAEDINLKPVLVFSQHQIIQWVLNQFVQDYEKLDDPTRFYLFCRLYGLDGMSLDTANLILEAMDIDLKEIKKAGFIKIIKKGRKKGLKILKFYERFDITIQYQIDAAHIALNLYEMVGLEKVRSFLHKHPDIICNILTALTHIEHKDVEKELAERIMNFREYSQDSVKDSFI
ncbi:hypothetical protein [Methanobacterium ferruginis]|uniref:hypothetical protein n=1 Tax=Methanobacterium ferruginis TaxID=710191 RepID=UPI0025733AEA|nr:hypothetical protein [Methanobacterium ferruginis]BDZ68791.1 hypothetical protein GCM10025860_22390 [Methanobacterium ferruginis]